MLNNHIDRHREKENIIYPTLLVSMLGKNVLHCVDQFIHEIVGGQNTKIAKNKNHNFDSMYNFVHREKENIIYPTLLVSMLGKNVLHCVDQFIHEIVGGQNTKIAKNKNHNFDSMYNFVHREKENIIYPTLLVSMLGKNVLHCVDQFIHEIVGGQNTKIAKNKNHNFDSN